MLFGLKNHPIRNEIELIEDYPSKIAQLLIDDKLDVGLIPVAATTKLSSWHIVGDYCIGCDGPVASVCLFSEVPISEVKTVLLDYQSRTSVNLAKVLLREYWQCDVKYINASGEDFRGKISGTTAGVVIGDRALEQRQHNQFIYDLGEAWKEFTGLPFVFAAWIGTKKLPDAFESPFNEAISEGLKNIDKVVAENPYKVFDLKKYFTQNISYQLTDEKRIGLSLFLKKLNHYNLEAQPGLRK